MRSIGKRGAQELFDPATDLRADDGGRITWTSAIVPCRTGESWVW